METAEISTHTSDEDLVRRVLNGETDLYEKILRRYNPTLYKTGRAYNFSHEDTQELMREAYVYAYRHLAQFGPRRPFRPWLLRIMLNECYRRQQQAGPGEASSSEKTTPMLSSAENEGGMHHNWLSHIVEDALKHIPEAYRVVFTLREISGLSVSEAADALEISESNVKARLNRAKTMLRDEILKMYSPSGIFEFNKIYCDRVVEQVMAAIKEAV